MRTQQIYQDLNFGAIGAIIGTTLFWLAFVWLSNHHPAILIGGLLALAATCINAISSGHRPPRATVQGHTCETDRSKNARIPTSVSIIAFLALILANSAGIAAPPQRADETSSADITRDYLARQFISVEEIETDTTGPMYKATVGDLSCLVHLIHGSPNTKAWLIQDVNCRKSSVPDAPR